jgi:hypothetical protein
MTAAKEFRVRWQREGSQPSYRIYQSEGAARDKIDSVLALEEIKAQTARWDDMPDLVAGPELQVRDVGEWSAADPGAQTEPSDSARTGVAEWAGINDRQEDPWEVAF